MLTRELTLELAAVEVRGILVDGEALNRACSRATFESGTFLKEADSTLIAFDPQRRRTVIQVE